MGWISFDDDMNALFAWRDMRQASINGSMDGLNECVHAFLWGYVLFRHAESINLYRAIQRLEESHMKRGAFIPRE